MVDEITVALQQRERRLCEQLHSAGTSPWIETVATASLTSASLLTEDADLAAVTASSAREHFALCSN